MRAVELNEVSKSFEGHHVLDRISLVVEEGELVMLSGPSGSGKTTLLRLIAGLEIPDCGRILINGKVASDNRTYMPPMDRNIGMVFQDLALWPHMTARRHLEFVINSRKISRQEKIIRVNDIIKLCRLEDKINNLPAKLSGGEQQRLAIARAIATDPRLLLLDEPFTSLDKEMREIIIPKIVELNKNKMLTVIVATHNQLDVDCMSGRIFEMNRK